MTAPWSFGDPNAGQDIALGGFPQYGQLGLLAPAQQGFNPLTARQPSVLDRVLGRLFPTGQYTGLLDSGAQRDVQRQGLVGLGTSLLRAGGPQAYQGGTLANLGGALQQSQATFPQMAEQALRLQAYRSQLARSAAIHQMAAQGGDPVAMIRQLTPLFADNPDALEKLGAAAKSLGGESDQKFQEVKDITDTRLGSPTFGLKGNFLIRPGQAKKDWEFVRAADATKIMPTDVLAYSKDFEGAIANHALAKQSYDTYQANQADTGATVDQTRLAAAINIVLPGSHMTGAQLSDPSVASSFKGTFLGPIVAALDPKTGTLPPAERKSLDAIVGNAVTLRKHESATITAQRRRLAQSQGINPDSYAIDPWAPGGSASSRPPLNFK